jgi:prepilin-type N-terminal cleavage/methylation domain-containing protein
MIIRRSSALRASGFVRDAGFTLLELLLAMAIFAAAAAMVIPLAGGMLTDRQLVRAGDQLRGELTRLRVHAIREGRVMMLHSNPDSAELMVVPLATSSDSIEASDTATGPSALLSGADQAMGVVTTENGSSSGWVIELPDEVVVRSVFTSAVGGAASVEAANLNASLDSPVNANSGAEDGVVSTGSLPVIYFYPTGGTSNAIITLGNRVEPGSVADDANVIRVQIRGLTGDVTLRSGS